VKYRCSDFLARRGFATLGSVELEYSLPPRLKQRLTDLARDTGRDESEILATAVLWYLRQVDHAAH
jgi:predicted transcriptional regulator